MCGFAGFLSFSGSALTVEERQRVLVSMGKAIAHRGPDDQQIYDDGFLSLVFRRLSIVDLEGGRQPIPNETGDRLIVVNGEIYNHLALRAELAGKHVFGTGSDSEVPLHVIEDDGPDGLRRLHGMFALAVWNTAQRELLLARDPLGIKPLYVCRLPDGVLFGSELKAILIHPQCPRDIDWRALQIFGVQQCSPVTTYIKDVEHLPGGHYLLAQDGQVRVSAYWRIDDYLGSAPFGEDAQAYRREYERCLEQVTVEHLLGDVPVGLHLSGGLDSSLLAAIAAARSRDLACFTVVERTSFRAGDVAAAQQVTTALGIPWFPVLFDYRTLLDEIQFDLERLEQSVFMMDSPRFDPEWIFKEELHRFARRQHPAMKVVLIGQGADEFAGGYSNRIDRPRSNWGQYLNEEVFPDLRYYDALGRHIPERLRVLSPLLEEKAAAARLGPYHRKMKLLTFQLQHFNLWHEDRTSAFQSLEARVPYLDHRLVELLASIPEALHAELFWNKRIVREAIRHRLPSYNAEHHKVPFFCTGDTRSIDVIVHEMVRRVAEPFIEKYLEPADSVLDTVGVRTLARNVLARRGGFYTDSWRLLECMVICIFVRQCQTPGELDFRHRRERRDGPVPVEKHRLDEIERLFATEPTLGAPHWHDGDLLTLAEDGEVLRPLADETSGLLLLTVRGVVCAQISVPSDSAWLNGFLRHVGRGEAKQFSVADWIDEFEVPPDQFRDTLDRLYQAGFIRKDLPAGAEN